LAIVSGRRTDVLVAVVFELGTNEVLQCLKQLLMPLEPEPGAGARAGPVPGPEPEPGARVLTA